MMTTTHRLPVFNAQITEVYYLCQEQHVTMVKYHSSVKNFPQTARCSTCTFAAHYVGSATLGKGSPVPNPKNSVAEENEIAENAAHQRPNLKAGDWYTKSHLEALFERRTEEELETLLEARLAKLRASRGE